MRDEFVRVLTDIAKKDKNVLLVTGDLGFGVLAQFAEELSDQFLNAGIAEQNMMGLAVGMALEGKVVYTYSIANFPTLRCLEQLRNDSCYHNANVKIVSIGGGFSYGSLGISHHATEDLAIIRALPSITVVSPGDCYEAAAATRAVYETPGTCYLRLGRGNEPKVHQGPIDFKIGKSIKISEGSDIIIFSTGGILKNALEARNVLSFKGMRVGLYSMHTIKPIDCQMVERAAEEAKLLVTIEEHSVIGGLGGAVAEVLAQMPGVKAKLKIIGLKDSFSHIVGDQEYLRNMHGISVESIVKTIEQAF